MANILGLAGSNETKANSAQFQVKLPNGAELGNIKYECNSGNVGYRLGCDTCAERGLTRVYEGESSRSARIRGAEHLADLKHNRPTGVLYKHKEIEHKSEDMKITMEIIKKFKDPC